MSQTNKDKDITQLLPKGYQQHIKRDHDVDLSDHMIYSIAKGIRTNDEVYVILLDMAAKEQRRIKRLNKRVQALKSSAA